MFFDATFIGGRRCLRLTDAPASRSPISERFLLTDRTPCCFLPMTQRRSRGSLRALLWTITFANAWGSRPK